MIKDKKKRISICPKCKSRQCGKVKTSLRETKFYCFNCGEIFDDEYKIDKDNNVVECRKNCIICGSEAWNGKSYCWECYKMQRHG